MSTNNDFSNSLGDLKKNIEYLIGMERAEGNLEPLTAAFLSRVLRGPVEEVEECMKEMGM